MKIPNFLCRIGLILITFSPAVYSNILKDSFDDNDRSMQSPPESAFYFTSQVSGTLIEEEGALILNGLNSNRFFIAYLTEPGEYYELGVGEAISLKFTFRPNILDYKRGKHLRFALFESGDSVGDRRAVSDDGFGSDLLGLHNYRGYQATLSFKNSEDNQQMVLGKRDKTFKDLLIGFHPEKSGYSHLGYNGRGDFVSKQAYTAQLNVIRVAPNKTEISGVVVAGGADSTAETNCFVEVIDSDAPTLRFDSFAIGLNATDGSMQDIRIEELEVFKVRKFD